MTFKHGYLVWQDDGHDTAIVGETWCESKRTLSESKSKSDDGDCVPGPSPAVNS